MPRRRDVLTGLALAATGLAVSAGRADPRTEVPVLRASWQDRLDTLDPYRTPLRTGLMLAHEVFDCLLDRDPETFQINPLLAESWTQEDDRTLAFKLRAGVTFHDGSPFGAEDVAATVRTVLSDPRLGIPSNYSWLAGAQASGDREIRLRLAHPFPAAPEYVAMVLPILPRDVASAERRAAMALAPVGTGPYRLIGVDPDGTLRLAAFDSSGAPPPKGVPAIRRLRIRQETDLAGPYADLTDGRADWIWQLTPTQVRELGVRDDLQVVRTDSMRVFYLSMDAAGRSGTDTPFAKLDARRAACHALDRTQLARETVPGNARPAIAPCGLTQFACDAGAAVRYLHDPARARALLADAGFPDGLQTELVTYVRPEIAEAAAAMLAEGGILARITVLPAAEAVARVAAGTAPLFLGSWGSSSINDISAFLPPFFAFGPLDMTRDAAVATLLAQAGLTVDPELRRGLYQQAIQRITDQAFILPLFVDPATYGISRKLAFRPMPDELPRFYRASWKPMPG